MSVVLNTEEVFFVDDDPPDLKELIIAYRQGDEKAGTEIYKRYNFLVTRITLGIAKRGVTNFVPYEDLVQEGVIGLFDAVRRYKFYGNFKAYAPFRIRGQIIDSLRGNSHFSRKMLVDNSVMDEAIHKLSQTLFREPTVDELAESLLKSKLSRNAEIIFEARQIFLEQNDFDRFSSNLITPEVILSGNEYESKILELINIIRNNSFLNEREKFVLDENILPVSGEVKTLKEIGVEIDVSESRVCQIRQEILKKIRKYLRRNNPELLNYFSD